MRFGRSFLLSLVLASPFSSGSCRPPGPETVVFLVRHAEKVDDSRDPELSDVGRHRASELAAFLASAGIDRIYSTNFIRTRETARPLAERLGLAVELYDEVEKLATTLESEAGRFLVVGHSNTVPDLVGRLGGDAGGPISDDEYDRVYIVSFPPGGDGATATTVLLRLPPPTP